MSNLVLHAEQELRSAGLFDKGSDYDGMIGQAVMKLVKTHAEEGHSGMSHEITLQVFNRVANYKTLTPISNAPAEWVNVSDYAGPHRPALWQNRRSPSLFSHDGGKTYYDLDEKPLRFRALRRFFGLRDKRMHTAKEA